MPASTSAQGVDLPAHPDTEHLSQVLHSAGSGQSGSSMLGNVTSTAQLQSLRSPRLQTTGIVSDAGLDGAASILDGKSSSPGTVHQSFTDPQQQQQLLSNNKGELIYLSRQKHITVDTRGSLKQSVFRVADLPAAQPNAQEQQQRSVSAQSVLHNFPADATAVADNHIDMQQQLRVPFAEYPDPTGNCNSHSSGHHLAAAPFPQHPNYAHSPHSSQTVFDTGPMNSSGSSFSGRAAQQSLNQVPCSPGLALPGSHATVIAKPEAVQAASRAALMQTSLQAQQAEGTELCSAVNALQPLVAAAEPMQLQQCLPQVCMCLMTS